MIIQDWYSTNVGQAILVPGGGAGNNGQCEQAVDSFHHDVNGLAYIYTPAASDWWFKAEVLGLTHYYDQIPASHDVLIGDIIIYNSNVGASEGHIDVASGNGSAADFWAYDSNWGKYYNSQGYPILHEVHHADSYNNDVVGKLRLKGDVVSKPDPNQINQLVTLCWGPGRATADDVAKLNAQATIQDSLNLILGDGRTAVWDKQVYQYINTPSAVVPYSGPPLYQKP